MEKNPLYLGIDVGSVSTNFVATNGRDEIVYKLYLRTGGQPIKAIRKGMKTLSRAVGEDVLIGGIGTTGSGRQLAGTIMGADTIKNEITTHAIAAQKLIPGVRTVMEIGGQDSKIIIIKNGVVYDFAMNTVCAAGTGSFLDRQAARLEIPINEFGSFALRAKSPVRIAGRCAVFAESDMVHKQQTGHSVEDIIGGLCEALVRNYLNNLGKGKKIEDPIVFQGGVAANIGIVQAFKKNIGKNIVIPKYYDVMGAYGAALIAREEVEAKGGATSFCGFEKSQGDYKARSIECSGCSNMCEVIEIMFDGKVLARWGDRFGKWSALEGESQSVS